MTEFGAGLALLVIGGMAWLAVNHPPVYRIAAGIMVSLMLGILIGAVTWQRALEAAKKTWEPFIPEPSREAAQKSAEGLYIPAEPFLIFVLLYFVAVLGLAILSLLVEADKAKKSR